MINIQDIIPFMKKGWVAMDKSGEWWWYRKKNHIKFYPIEMNGKKTKEVNGKMSVD